MKKLILKLEDSGAQSNSNDIDNDVDLANLGSLYKRDDKRNYQDDTEVHDLEDEGMPGTIPTISHHVSMSNGHLGGGRSGSLHKKGPQKPGQQNGFIPNGRPDFRSMLDDAESMDSHI